MSIDQPPMVQVNRLGAVLHLVIDRPERKNALTRAMYTRLSESILEADQDPQVRAIVISGNEGCFTSGNDLGDFLEQPELVDGHPTVAFLRAIAEVQKPLLAAVSGAAVGIGTTLLLHCDLAYADDTAMFQMPFVNLGLCPEAASSLLLPRLVGHPRAAELLLLGRRFDAAQALDWGMINDVATNGDVVTLTLEKAQQLAKQPAAAVRLCKSLLKRSQQSLVSETLGIEIAHFTQRLQSPEAKEAMQAFFEKRQPDFSQFD